MCYWLALSGRCIEECRPGCAYRALLASLAWCLTNSIWSISIVIAPDHSPAMHHDTALLPCDWSTGGMQPFDWMTERSTTIKYQWYQENSHKPNFSHKKVVMMHICEQNSDQISQGQKQLSTNPWDLYDLIFPVFLSDHHWSLDIYQLSFFGNDCAKIQTNFYLKRGNIFIRKIVWNFLNHGNLSFCFRM